MPFRRWGPSILPPGLLTLEMTESVLFEHNDEWFNALRQGFHPARPMPADEVQVLLESEVARRQPELALDLARSTAEDRLR